MTLDDRGESPSREEKVARKRARMLRSLGKRDAAAREGNALVAEQDSNSVVTVSSQGSEPATNAESRELTSRREKVISLRRSSLKLADAAPAPAPLGDEDQSSHPRLLVGPMPHVTKSRWMTWSALLMVGLPTLIVGLYFAFFATNQFHSEGRFALRSNDASSGAVATGIAASLGLGGSTSTTGDSYIIVDYLHSRRLVEELQSQIDLRRIFSHPGADWYARLDPAVSIESLVKYWQSMTYVYFDSMTGIVYFSARAFTPDDAQRIADAALASAENLVNELSRRARDDSLQTAKDEVSRAELRLRFARKSIRAFRDRERQVDPVQLSAQRMAVLQQLEGDLATQEADRATVDSFLRDDAPSVRMMQNKIDALRKRIDAERSKLGNSDLPDANGKKTEVMSSILGEYEELEGERLFAEEVYKSALASLEGARMNAERKMRYVASFVAPNRAEDAEYPERLKDTLLVFVACTIIWVISVLIFFGVRDQSV